MVTSRSVSLDILNEVIYNKAYSGIALSKELSKHKHFDERDRRFITEITKGVLRNITFLDYAISQFSNVPIKKVRPVVLNILRQGAYQIMCMDAACHAACSEAVKLAKSRGVGGLSGFINGVLRNLARSFDNIEYPDEQKDTVKYLAVVFSHPEWIVEKWLAQYGYKFVKELLKKNNEPPFVTICANTLKTCAADLIHALEKEGVLAKSCAFNENAFVIENSGGIAHLDAFKNGLFHVQDLSSQTAVLALNPKKGDTVIDLCAAPGGKSFLCAYMMENTGKIYSTDIRKHKIKLMEDGAKRLGITIIDAKTGDAEILNDSFVKKADCVLVDAPCSGLGLIRKKPDIRLNKSKEHIAPLQKVQRSILSVAAQYVKEGGSLLYSTCTLTDEENTDNMKWFLNKFDFEPIDFSHLISCDLKPFAEKGRLELFPHIHNTDGFFICKFIRKG